MMCGFHGFWTPCFANWRGQISEMRMMGATLTIMRLDDELRTCLDLPATSVGLTHVP